MRVFIADDDGISRSLVTKMLQYFGYEVTLAQDGTHAWQLLQNPNAPELIILDWLMPGMDGISLCKKLRAVKKYPPPYIILLTGMNNSDDVATAFSAGADDYMTKPFNPDELFGRVRAGERILKLQIESKAAKDALCKQPSRDPLTGVQNRDAIFNELNKLCLTSGDADGTISVIRIDIDNLKSIADAHGPQSSDKILLEVVKYMVLKVRSYEAIGRLGDEQFLVIVKGRDLADTEKLAERIKKSITKQEFDLGGVKILVSISTGAASSSQITTPTPDVLIEMAETAMNNAIQTG